MIKSISLQNFKCFKSRSFSVEALSLLTGLNSAGKSTVLQALLLLRQSYMQQSLPKRGLLLNGPLLNLGTSEGILNKSAEEDTIGITVKSEAQEVDWAFAYHGPNEDILPVTLEPEDYEGIPLFHAPFQYIAAERIGPRSVYEHSYYNVHTKGQIGADGRYAVAFLESRARESVSVEMRHASAKDETLFSQVTAWLSEISPGVQLSISLRPGTSSVQLRVGFTPALAEAIDYFDPRNVGYGVSYSLAIIVAVLSLPPGGILIVENPEAHLHSKGQVAMANLFARAAKSGIQVFVETHSDHFLNGIRIAVKDKVLPGYSVSINYFRRDLSKFATYEIDTPRVDQDGRIDRWPNDFFDQWDKSLDRLLE